MFVFGIEETVRELEAGRVKILIVWEELDLVRFSSDDKVFYMKPSEAKSENKISLIDWFVENVKAYDSKISLISDRTQEGSQFCKGFGGVGGNRFLCLLE